MKNRIETKNSIRQKSKEILKVRARNRKIYLRVGISAVACIAIGFLAVGTRAIYFGIQSDRDDFEFVDAEKSAYPDKEEMERLYDGEVAKSESHGESVMCYAMPESVRIYTLPESEEIFLSAENTEEEEYIISVDRWIRELDAKDIDGNDAPDEGLTYVVERIYGDKLTTAYIQGNMIKFDDGNWKEFSIDQKEKFEQIIQQIL